MQWHVPGVSPTPCGEPLEESAAGGLSFHRHERNWLLLLSGRKRWYFHAGEPATALARIPEEELQQREAEFGPLVQMHDQTPGECILIPDGHWHCTYNSTEHFTFGVGGMGRIGSVSEALAAEGDVGALRQVSAAVLQAEAPQLLSTSAEQGQLSVLKFLVQDLGVPVAEAAPGSGATPLHVAAGAGALEVVGWLLEVCGVSPDVRDIHGTTPCHWCARSGSVPVLELLEQAGAEMDAQDSHSKCTAMHLMAAEGHGPAALYLARCTAAAAVADAQGRFPEAVDGWLG
eukprot:s1389_g6.t2